MEIPCHAAHLDLVRSDGCPQCLVPVWPHTLGGQSFGSRARCTWESPFLLALPTVVQLGYSWGWPSKTPRKVKV